MLERSAGVGGGTGVFHPAGYEIIDHGLGVLFPWIIDAEFFAEEFDHLGSTAVIDGEAVAAAFGRVISDRDAAPRILYFFKFASDDGDEIGGAGDRFFPGPSLRAVAGVGDVDKLAVGNGDPGGRNGEDGFGGEAVVRVVVGREVVARVFGFALRPDLFGAVRIVLVGQDEVEALGGFGFVANVDVEPFASVRRGGERDDELVVLGFKLGGGFIHGSALDRESGRVKKDFRGRFPKDGKRVRDIANDFFVIEIEAQRDARVLQVIVAAASVGFVGTEVQRDGKNGEYAGDGNRTSAARLAVSIPGRWEGHSDWLLWNECPARSSAETAAARLSEATSR